MRLQRPHQLCTHQISTLFPKLHLLPRTITLRPSLHKQEKGRVSESKRPMDIERSENRQRERRRCKILQDRHEVFFATIELEGRRVGYISEEVAVIGEFVFLKHVMVV